MVIKKIAILCSLLMNVYTHVSFDLPMNFVTVSDTEHVPWLKILLRSIIDHNPGKQIQILIVDIGFSREEIDYFQNEYTRVIPLEIVNPDLTKKFVVRTNGRVARGWYAWKPVAIKQGFEYFDYFLYIDAGKRLVGPADDIFSAIVQHGYFFFDCGHTIAPMTIDRVKTKFELDLPANRWILNQFGLEAGIQGLSRSVYDTYVVPMYKLAHEIEWFADDGSAPWGMGGSRHDQTLFSILARINGYTIHKVCGDGPSYIVLKNKKAFFNRNHYFQYKRYDDNPLAKECNLE